MKKPNSLLNNLARIFVTTIYYLADSSHLLLNLFNRKYSIKIIYLRTITEKSHQLEKGFTKSQFRSCFGTHAIQVLIKALEKYHKMGFDVNDLRFKCGVDSLYMYKDKHVGVNCENCNKITRFFNKYPELTNHYSSGNFVVTNTELEKLNFDLFANFVYNFEYD